MLELEGGKKDDNACDKKRSNGLENDGYRLKKVIVVIVSILILIIGYWKR